MNSSSRALSYTWQSTTLISSSAPTSFQTTQ